MIEKKGRKEKQFVFESAKGIVVKRDSHGYALTMPGGNVYYYSSLDTVMREVLEQEITMEESKDIKTLLERLDNYDCRG